MHALRSTLFCVASLGLALLGITTPAWGQMSHNSELLQAWSTLDLTLLQNRAGENRKAALEIYSRDLKITLKERANAGDQSGTYWRLRGISHKLKMIEANDCNTANTILRNEEFSMTTNDEAKLIDDGVQALKVLQTLCQ